MPSFTARWGLSRLNPGTVNDNADTQRMRLPTQLSRDYSLYSMIGYMVVIALTYPYVLVSTPLGLANGGTGGAFWVFVVVCVGMFSMAVSMAEMVSIEPSAGGQYHWVTKFAPHKYHRPLGFFVGWMSALGWQSIIPGVAYVAATNIQALAVIWHPTYVPTGWEAVGITIFFCIAATIFNIFLRPKVPFIEVTVLLAYIVMFIVLIAVFFGINAPSHLDGHILVDIQDNSDWGSLAGACFIGLSGPVITLIGSDSGVHLAEEVKDSSKTTPTAMLSVPLINYFLGILTLAAFLLRIDNLDEVLDTPTLVPYIQVLLNVVQSRAAVTVIISWMILFFVFGAFNSNVTTSRQLYALAREGGFPFPKFVSHVSPQTRVPMNAAIITCLIGILISLIAGASSFAFLVIQTIGNSGLLTSYMITIGCRLYHRNCVSLYGTRDDPPPFFLGKFWGNAINIFAIICAFTFFVIGFFPVAPHPTSSTFNWSIVFYVGIGLLAVPVWFFSVRHNFGRMATSVASPPSEPVETDTKGDLNLNVARRSDKRIMKMKIATLT
ncbi:amino acid transporter [Rhizodiscina lignyota]|uniref:Amino acid transporter n=1 Tax=Rhizodiscina lignyota TaxID=1504668 RepID=A0A9P4IAC9_9PEZI|nr:amino acid transporter [Rhizodiscina lignyota]